MPTSGTCPNCRTWSADLTPRGVCVPCAAAQEAATGTTDRAVTGFTGRPADPAATTAGAPPVGPTPRPTAPPGYDLLSPLGFGGMGLVYLARERATDRRVAVKYVFALTHPTARDRFRVEVQALAKVRHPNVVSVFAVEMDGREPYFTMEYLPGGPLSRRLVPGPLSPTDAARVVAGVARGVAAAHAAGILHRDLKPGNILLDEDGTPKVADFGLAKPSDRDDGLTRSGSLVGTPGYMAPEQAARRNDEVGPGADVYGLGAVLYECLTGRPPFKELTAYETTLRVVSDPPAPPRSVRPELPADLEAVCLKCLEKRPGGRYASAADLADDLDRFLAGEPTLARPRAWPARAWRRAKRRWRWAAAAAVLLAAAGAGAMFAPAVQPPDSHARVRRELAAGRAVTIVPAAGVPAGMRDSWLLGPTALEASATADGACSFESIDDSLFTLLADPGVDRYRVTAEVRMLRTKLAAPRDADKPPPLGEANIFGAGLFFGHTNSRGAGGAEGHAFLSIHFRDYVPPEVANRPLPPGQIHPPITPVVGCKSGVVLLRPGREPFCRDSGASNSRPVRYVGKPPPGEWHRVRIEVAPEFVRADWATHPDGPTERVAVLTPDEVRENYADMQNWFDKYFPEAGIRLPGWRPRMPVGIWSRGAAVAVRNVIAEPLP